MNDIDDIRARAETCWTKTQLRADVQTLLARVDELESDCAALKVGIEAISSLCDRKEAERDSLKAQRDALAELVEAADLAADVYPDTDDPDFDDAMSDMCQALAKLKEVE